jgi:AraC-like DNA-binding protein
MSPRSDLVETRPAGAGRSRGLVSSRVSGSRVDARGYVPPDALRDVVATLWTGSWDLRDQAPHVTERVSDPCVNLVFEDGDGEPGGRVVGVWTRLWRRTLRGRGRVWGAKLRAGAARAFVPLPARAYTDRIVPLAAVFGASAIELERAVRSAADDASAFAAFEAWLLATRVHDPATARAIEVAHRITTDPAITTVEGLAATTGLTPRALQRLFHQHVGVSPKHVIRTYRLQEAALRIERGDVSTLADLAAELGYTDQAHLAHDFKTMIGKSPSAFARSVHT